MKYYNIIILHIAVMGINCFASPWISEKKTKEQIEAENAAREYQQNVEGIVRVCFILMAICTFCFIMYVCCSRREIREMFQGRLGIDHPEWF